MADYWKSQPRKFCDFCKCWIADNKPSRDFHERGKRHQENVAKKITEVRKKGLEQARNEKDCDGWMEQMEREAMKKLREDLKADPSLASQYGVIIKSRSVEVKTTKEESTEKVTTDSIDGSSSSSSCSLNGDWQEELSPEGGYVYYWNRKTGESRWDVPEDDATQMKAAENKECRSKSKAEEKRREVSGSTEGSDKVVERSDSSRQQGTDGATGWQKLQSADGYPYYWNTQTGEVSWELPSFSIATVAIQSKEAEEEELTSSVPSAAAHNDEKSSNPKEAATETKNKSHRPPPPPPKSPATEEEEEEEEEEKVEPVHRKPRASVYGEWQELKDESEPLLDLQLPVDESGGAGEVRTIVLTAEPKMKFKEKTMETLGVRSKQQQQPVEFKKRKLNSAAAKGNIRRAVDEDT